MTDLTRAQFGLEQVRTHVAALDRELRWLAKGAVRSPGEWARDAATPIVRTDCITNHLKEATAARPAATAEERRRQGSISAARDELRSSLSETASSLTQLSDPAAGAKERREVLEELPLHRVRQQRLLRRLHDLIE